MPDREKIIRAVDSCFDYWLDQHRCIHPLELEKVRQIKADALAMLKEQDEVEIADKAITVDISIPEQFWPSMQYDPSEDVVACTSCLICGKDIPLRRYESGPRVCSECKKAVTAMKRGD